MNSESKRQSSDRENCPFCGSADTEWQGSSNFVLCKSCRAFGPDGSTKWEHRSPSRRVKALIEHWRDESIKMENGSSRYSAAYDAVSDLLYELEAAVRVHPL